MALNPLMSEGDLDAVAHCVVRSVIQTGTQSQSELIWMQTGSKPVEVRTAHSAGSFLAFMFIVPPACWPAGALQMTAEAMLFTRWLLVEQTHPPQVSYNYDACCVAAVFQTFNLPLCLAK